MTEKLIITIDNEKNSGGDQVAETIAKRLRIKCYDDKSLECATDDERTDKIQKIAAKESCVFLISGANDILKNHSHIIRVYLCSSKSKGKHLSSEQNNANRYDLCINTAIIGNEGAVQVILEYLTAKS